MTQTAEQDLTTMAPIEERFCCANTGEIMMPSETCSGRSYFTVPAVSLASSHILTHLWLCLSLLISIQICIEITKRCLQDSKVVAYIYNDARITLDTTSESTENNYNIHYIRKKELVHNSLLPEETDTSARPCIFFSHLSIQKFPFDFQSTKFFFFCTNIHCNITVPCQTIIIKTVTKQMFPV